MFWLPCDELDDLKRYTICIAPARDENHNDADPRSSKNVITRIQATTRNRNPAAAALPVLATAIAVDASDVLIGEGGLNMSGIVTSATAYVDPVRRCVFAMRMQLANATMRSVGYWLLPPYGDAAVAATDAGAAPPRCAPAAVIPSGLLDDGIDWGGRGAPRAMPAAAGADDAALFDLFEQPATPVLPRVTFGTPAAAAAGVAGAAAPAAGLSDADAARVAAAFRTALLPDLAALVRDAVRVELASSSATATAAAAPAPDTAAAAVTRADLAAAEARAVAAARAAAADAAARVERAVTEATTAAAAVTLRQMDRRLSGAGAGASSAPWSSSASSRGTGSPDPAL
ncbi:hypothetical protein HK405_001365 [Cladochytrium tenue]|nr:hypothetical protein HK405_001365 [Cladochytrium tenue]